MRRLQPSRMVLLAAVVAVVVATVPAAGVGRPATADPTDAGTALWTPASDAAPQARGRRRTVDPQEYRAYTLDDSALGAALAGAPLEGTRAARRGGAADLVVPAPTGELVHFTVVEAPVMQDALQAAHPEIRTYAGNAVGFPDSIRLDVTPAGFHASVRSPDHPTWYVDPAYVGDDSRYLTYFGDTLPDDQQPLVEPTPVQAAPQAGTGQDQARPGDDPDNLVKQRTYRLALLTDPSYAEYVAPGLNDGAHDTQSNAAVLAAKVTLMNRVNQVYNDDLGITMTLINGSDALNLNTAAKAQTAGGACGTAPCFNATGAGSFAGQCSSELLVRQRHVIGLLAGAGTFDIGHLMLGVNGGGLASLGVVGSSTKAQGCTGVTTPVGDVMAIDYVAHEMGHQFGADHTFNGTQSNCASTNRNPGTSVEPGSGSSVMAYAGICTADNLQPHSDPYFSQRTQTEVGSYVTSAASAPNEVQEVALNGYDGTESLTLQFGSTTTAAIVNGTNYTAAGIASAVQAVTGGTVTVAGLYGDATVTTTGFQLTYAGALAGQNVVNPTLQAGAGFTGRAADITQGGTDARAGYTVTKTANHNPVVTAPPTRTIPVRTPFALTGSAVDADGDSLSYLWEQNDPGSASSSGGTALTKNTKANGPLFRVFGTYAAVTTANSRLYNSPGENLTTSSPSRTFPDLAQVVAGSTNAATGACPTVSGTATLANGPTLDCYSEFLPTTSYVGTGANNDGSLDFRLTARDQRPNGGGSGYADVKLNVDRTTGPFQVTSQATTGLSYAGASSQTVSWTTNTAPLAANVRITLSTDGGQTFDQVLASSTPNDGSQSVSIPNVSTNAARIRIEAIDNYFFDVNDAAFSITASPSPPAAPADTTAPDTVITTGPVNGTVLTGRSTTYGFGATETASYQCAVDGVGVACGAASATLEVAGLAARSHLFTVAAVDASGNVDASPARRTFVVPVDDRALKDKGKAWTHRKVTQVQRPGAILTYRISGATALSLVARTGRRDGKVVVLLGKKRLATVSLKGKSGSGRVFSIASFAVPVSGKVTIRTTTNQRVVVDGLAVSTVV